MVNLFEDSELTDKEREKYPGKFIELSSGVTHYDIEGDEDGEVIVLVHGFSVPMFCWDPTFEMLVKEGYRVLRYDLFGRGYYSQVIGVLREFS